METQNESPHERWLPVVGYEGWYDVSNYGRVRRMAEGSNITFIGKILKPMKNSRGYFHVNLSKNSNKRIENIHRLVATSFIGLCPDGLEVNHIDGDKTNNRADNLEYVSSSENQIHSYSLGLQAPVRGEAHGCSKLTEDNVHSIRLQIGHDTYAVIGEREGVCAGTIGSIARGKIWGWLEEE